MPSQNLLPLTLKYTLGSQSDRYSNVKPSEETITYNGVGQMQHVGCCWTSHLPNIAMSEGTWKLWSIGVRRATLHSYVTNG